MLELAAAAQLYDLPIILFFYETKMAFFDWYFKPKSILGERKHPLYLHHKEG